MLSNVNIALSGFVRAHNGLRLLQDRNCIVRGAGDDPDGDRSSAAGRRKKVRLISGGGSGHEPAHIGFVGRGMLDGAVCGDVFCSPSATAIVDCLRTVADPTDEVLFIVNNYTGDRLNFGLAIERARSLYGYGKVRILLNDDDCSIEESLAQKSVGKRGLAGSVLLIKILGAMAELGHSLEELYRFGDDLLRQGHLVTFGFTFDVASDGDKLQRVELGKGLHGEPGVYRMNECDGFEPIVQFMMEKMGTKVHESAEVVVLVNNLGATSELMVGIFLETLSSMLEKRYKIRRIYAGTFFSSLSQVGLSVTLLNLEYSEQILKYLDHEVQVPSPLFARPSIFSRQPSQKINFEETTDPKPIPSSTNFKLKFAESSKPLIHKTIEHISQVLLTNRDLLNTFDRECGDGDTGNTIANGASALLANLHRIDLLHPAQLLQDISMLLQLSVGGTSGAIYSLFFHAASQAFQDTSNDHQPIPTKHHWLNALAHGNDAIIRYAQAELGDRTMLDPLRQGEFRLRTAIQQNLSEPECVEIFSHACEDVAKATQYMRPRSGRATYSAAATGEQDNAAVVDYRYPDPGAHAVAVWSRALFEAYTIFFNK